MTSSVHRRNIGSSQEAEAQAGVSPGFYWAIYRKEARQCGVNSLGLSSLNNFGGLKDVDVVPSCLTPGPGISKEEEYCHLWCTGQTEAEWLWVG